MIDDENEKREKKSIKTMINDKRAVELPQKTEDPKEKLFMEKLSNENFEEKCKFADLLTRKIIEAEKIPDFLTDDDFIRFLLSQIPTDFFSEELFNLLNTILFRRERGFGLQLSYELLTTTNQWLENYEGNDFHSIFSILSYILIENIDLLSEIDDFVGMILAVTENKVLTSNSAAELASLSSVLLTICSESSSLSDEEKTGISGMLFALLTSKKMDEKGIQIVFNCAAAFIYDDETNNMIKETGFFEHVMTHFFDYSEQTWKDELNYLSQCLANSEDGEETGLEGFDEMRILPKLLSCNNNDEDEIINFCNFLTEMVPLREERIEEWMSTNILEWSLLNFCSFNHLEKACLVDLFINIINAGPPDVVFAIIETEMIDNILEMFNSYSDDRTKLSILKMILRVIILFEESGTSNDEFIEKVERIIEEALNSHDDEIAEVSAAIDEKIHDD